MPNYSRVSVVEAKANGDYWLVLRHMFREQAARVLQRAWRRKKQKPFVGIYTETLTNNAKLLRFIQEPTDNTFHDHAQKILNGDWLSLNFQEPEFARNLYKALRMGLLNRTQFSTALLLYSATLEFKNPIQQFRFDGKGPYTPESIVYATPERLASFYEKLKELPENEQCYFSVNFSTLREALFLYDTLVSEKYLPAIHEDFFIAFVRKAQASLVMSEDYLRVVDNLKSTDADNAVAKIIDLIRLVYSEYSEYLQYRYTTKNDLSDGVIVRGKDNLDLNSQSLISAIYATMPQLPMVRISSDYDATDANSPLFCFIIPNISVFSALELAMHSTQTEVPSLPFFTAGQISTRLIKALDESPEVFSQAAPSRPVELVHPDLVSNPSPHGAGRVYAFSLSYHDLFHTWQNGMLLHKPFVRYLRQLVIQETGFDMSKVIWQMTDMDFSSSLIERMAAKNKDDNALIFSLVFRVLSVGLILGSVGSDFWKATLSHDINLLMILDMVLNHSLWKNKFLVSATPEEAFKANTEFWEPIAEVLSASIDRKEVFFFYNDLNHFHQAILFFKNIISTENASGVSHSNIFYLLAFRLRDHAEGLSLCKQLESIGLNEFVEWTRNNGLKLTNSLEPHFLSTMPVDALYNQLHELAENNQTPKLSNRAMC